MVPEGAMGKPCQCLRSRIRSDPSKWFIIGSSKNPRAADRTDSIDCRITSNNSTKNITNDRAISVQDAIERLKARWESGEGEELQNANLLLILASIKSKDSATVENSLKLADEALGIGDLLDRLKS